MNPFPKFQLYEFLANVVPGSLILLVGFLLFHPDISNYGTILIAAVFLILAYTAGQVIQAISSIIEVREDHFGKIINDIHNEQSDEVEEKFWKSFQNQFAISSDYSNTSRILRLVLSQLESSETKALKLQRIYTFHRSMWALFTLFSVSSLIILVYGLVINPFVSLKASVIAFVSSGILALIFYKRMKKFSYVYIEYVVSDFIVES